jgi:osmotically-inducible protein OsmY
MRSNMELQRDVGVELKWDPKLRDEEIAVVAKDGVVTLGGTVDSFAAKYAAVRAAERVAGVTAVADDIEVKLAGVNQKSDTELAHQVTNALKWNVLVPELKVKARVDNGWVTLDGEVEWDFQRKAAFRAVRDLVGVRGVANLVTIKQSASPFDVSTRIKDALRRQAELDASHIEVEAHEGTVTLRGKVHSWTERRQAEAAAWGAPGVSRVEDRLLVET